MSSTCNRASSTCWRLSRVDRAPCRVLTICPLSVAVAGGSCLDINSYVSPGKESNWWLRMAFNNVDGGGEPRV